MQKQGRNKNVEILDSVEKILMPKLNLGSKENEHLNVAILTEEFGKSSASIT